MIPRANILLATALTMITSAAAFVMHPSSFSSMIGTQLSMTKQRGGGNSKRKRNERTSYGIGKDWDGHWNKKYNELVAERMWNPSFKYEDNSKLWEWQHIQMENLRRGVMNHDRKKKLALIGIASPAPTSTSTTTWKATAPYPVIQKNVITNMDELFFHDFFPPNMAQNLEGKKP